MARPAHGSISCRGRRNSRILGRCDWWYGRDGQVQARGPGVQPLAHGATARVVKLRGYGDAICVPAAQAFVEAYLTTDH